MSTTQRSTISANARGMRFELAVVMAVAVLPFVISSARAAMLPEKSPSTPPDFAAAVFSNIRQSLGGLLLVAYVVYQRRESLVHFGWRVRPAVIPASVALFVTAIGAYFVVRWAVYSTTQGNLGWPERPPQDAIRPDAAALWLLMVVVSPVFEEVVVRAYLMTRLRDLGCGPAWCVLASTLVQASYHLHKGLNLVPSYAAVFLVFSLCFARYRNLPVVVLAHLYIDIVWWCSR